ncbi:MAG: hypothetical protein PVJ28_11400 [Acidimicrobiia bacterium]
MRTSPIVLGVLLSGLGLATFASALAVADVLRGGAEVGWIVGGILWSLVPAVFAMSGTLIVLRQPANAVGWLLIVPGLALLEPLLNVPQLVEAPTIVDLGVIFQLWLNNVGWMMLIFPVFLLLMVFPTGRLLSRRWGWLVGLVVVMVAFLGGLGLFSETLGPLEGGSWTVANPIGFVPNSLFESVPFQVLWAGGLLTLTVSGLLAVVLRFRRAEGVERQQMKWLLYAVSVFGFVYVLAAAIEPLQGQATWDLFLVISLLAMPLAIMIAVTRHRLYEIDRIISRTLSYGLVVLLLAAGYFGVVTVIGTRVSDQPLFVAAATLAAAALFNPLRRRVQAWVDRRFNRSRYDAARVVDRFTGTLRDQVDPAAVVDGWVGVVSETMQPASVGIWMRE